MLPPIAAVVGCAGTRGRGRPEVTASAATAPTTAAAPPATTASHRGDPDPRPREAVLSSYKPTYIVAGPSTPNAKFQFSVKFRLFSAQGAVGGAAQPLANLYFGYTQTALWDVESPSQTTLDITHMPELFFATHTLPRRDGRLGTTVMGFQFGVQHESNGRPGLESRNVNYLYMQPALFFGTPQGLNGEIGPKLRAYFSGSGDNPDIAEYYGHVDLYGALRVANGLQAAATGRLGDDGDKGAIQLDLSYPLKRYIGGEVDTFFHVQYFNGFGESLLEYNEHSQSIRAGVSFVR
jgi:phospholipase A1